MADARASSVVNFAQTAVRQRHSAFAINPLRFSLFVLAYLIAYGYGNIFSLRPQRLRYGSLIPSYYAPYYLREPKDGGPTW